MRLSLFAGSAPWHHSAATSAQQLRPSALQVPAALPLTRPQPGTSSAAPSSSTAAHLSARRIGWACKAGPEDDVQAIEDVRLPQLSAEALHEEQEWLAGSVQLWLDEEWTVLQEHEQLGEAVSQSYRRLRSGGSDDLTDVLLGMSSDLMETFDFKPTFVNAFEVANKVSELLMMRHMGEGSCCTTDADRERYGRMPSSSSNNGTAPS